MITTTCWILWIPTAGTGVVSVAVTGAGDEDVPCRCDEPAPQPASTSAAATEPNASSRVSTRRWLLLVGREVLLTSAADGTEPRLRYLLESRAGRDAAVRIPLRRVVDEPARLAHPLHARSVAPAFEPASRLPNARVNAWKPAVRAPAKS